MILPRQPWDRPNSYDNFSHSQFLLTDQTNHSVKVGIIQSNTAKQVLMTALLQTIFVTYSK